MTLVVVTTVCFSKMLLGLTPLERWNAVTNYHSSSASSRWFMVIGLVIIGVLSGLLFIVHRRQKSAQKSSGQLFAEYAEAKKLTDREYRVLMKLAVGAELMRSELIFTLPSAFDRESGRLLENTRAEQGIEQSRQLQIELALLREKLGFHRPPSLQQSPATEAGVQSTQQIPVNKKFYIKRNRYQDAGYFEATVIENSPEGLTLQFRTPVEIVFGQSWSCRYYTGAFVAEFNTTVLKCSGLMVVLAHSDHVQLINRRRFLRVPVQKPAYVAEFPFKKELIPGDGSPVTEDTAIQNRTNPGDQCIELPQFVPATVTELGGPGLRINTRLRLTTGDRILILFTLDTAPASGRQPGGEKLIGHIANVRHITTHENGSSVALELTGLHEDGIDELIRATNRASFKMNKRKNSPESGIDNIWTEEVLSA